MKFSGPVVYETIKKMMLSFGNDPCHGPQYRFIETARSANTDSSRPPGQQTLKNQRTVCLIVVCRLWATQSRDQVFP